MLLYSLCVACITASLMAITSAVRGSPVQLLLHPISSFVYFSLLVNMAPDPHHPL